MDQTEQRCGPCGCRCRDYGLSSATSHDRELSAGCDSITYVLDCFQADAVGGGCADARRDGGGKHVEVDGQVDRDRRRRGSLLTEPVHPAPVRDPAFFVQQIADAEAVRRVEQRGGVARLADSEHAVLRGGARRMLRSRICRNGVPELGTGSDRRSKWASRFRIPIRRRRCRSRLPVAAEVRPVGHLVAAAEDHREVSGIERSADARCRARPARPRDFSSVTGNGAGVARTRSGSASAIEDNARRSASGPLAAPRRPLLRSHALVAGESDQNAGAGSCFGVHTVARHDASADARQRCRPSARSRAAVRSRLDLMCHDGPPRVTV